MSWVWEMWTTGRHANQGGCKSFVKMAKVQQSMEVFIANHISFLLMVCNWGRIDNLQFFQLRLEISLESFRDGRYVDNSCLDTFSMKSMEVYLSATEGFRSLFSSWAIVICIEFKFICLLFFPCQTCNNMPKPQVPNQCSPNNIFLASSLKIPAYLLIYNVFFQLELIGL